ncbi:MAG: helix-turn-helix domain-containing protein [Holophagales bacterium]|nr:helix-turn-helix domain-containing protein [Holophagales bacterium]
MPRICILALPSVFDSALTITRDILLAGLRTDVPAAPSSRFTVELATEGRQAVQTSGGLEIHAQTALSEIEHADYLLVPGFGLPGEESLPAIERYLARSDIGAVLDGLRRFRASGGAVAAGCTATFLLAEAGLLDGLQATTSWWLADEFRDRFPAVDLQAHMMLTHQEGVTCAGAALAHTDLALWVLGELRGPATSDFVARRLLLDERVSQGRYMAVNHLSRRHPEVPRAEAWIRERLGEPIKVEDLAAALALRPRTLARRLHNATGESPLSFIQRLRVEHAVHLLETSPLSFEQIAARVGYQEPAGLRRIIRRRTGRSPSDFRRAGLGTA